MAETLISSVDGELHTSNENLQDTIPSKGLVMAGLNINSLLAHIDDLRVFMTSQKIDILALNETKLDATIRDNEIHLPGFDVIRKDRSANGRNGGAYIYVTI